MADKYITPDYHERIVNILERGVAQCLRIGIDPDIILLSILELARRQYIRNRQLANTLPDSEERTDAANN